MAIEGGVDEGWKDGIPIAIRGCKDGMMESWKNQDGSMGTEHWELGIEKMASALAKSYYETPYKFS